MLLCTADVFRSSANDAIVGGHTIMDSRWIRLSTMRRAFSVAFGGTGVVLSVTNFCERDGASLI